jgi:ParB family chromosome partitioning protein
MKRKALGKGLSSLIPSVPSPRAPSAPPSTTERPGEGLRQIDLDRIWPNPSQPRQRFDARALEELAASLKSEGVLQPVIVRPTEGGYELIAGERRWRAAQIAGLLRIPAVVRDVSDDRLLQLALIENLQREELSPIEEAHAYQTLINELGLSQQEVADRVGKQRATVANALRLLSLPVEVQDLIQGGELSAGHAKALAGLSDSRAQIDLARRIVRDDLSVRVAESLVRRPGKGGKRARSQPEARDPNVVAAEEQLRSVLGTRVRIVQGRSGSGRVELHFFSSDELERLFDVVMRGTRQR